MVVSMNLLYDDVASLRPNYLVSVDAADHNRCIGKNHAQNDVFMTNNTAKLGMQAKHNTVDCRVRHGVMALS